MREYEDYYRDRELDESLIRTSFQSYFINTLGHFTYLLNINSKHMYFICEIVILIKIVILIYILLME
jgi:hypothetical protein